MEAGNNKVSYCPYPEFILKKANLISIKTYNVKEKLNISFLSVCLENTQRQGKMKLPLLYASEKHYKTQSCLTESIMLKIFEVYLIMSSHIFST